VATYGALEGKYYKCSSCGYVIDPEYHSLLLCPTCGIDWIRKVLQYKCPYCGRIWVEE
jgi:predicted RNA-binding Zn-ribbon protein involved in translation (DUF1610 family)